MMTIALLMLLQDTPENLCASLASDDLDTRDRATFMLVRLGRPALAPLERVADDEDALARARFVTQQIVEKLRPKALDLDLVLDKYVYAPGEIVHVEARLKNIEGFAVTTLRPEAGGAAVVRLTFTLKRDRTPVSPTAIQPAPGRDPLTEGSFVALAPGAVESLFRTRFGHTWEQGPAKCGDVGPPKTVATPLVPGRYRLEALYSVQIREPHQVSKKSSPKALIVPEPPPLDPRLRTRHDECWRGSIRAAVEFSVEAR